MCKKCNWIIHKATEEPNSDVYEDNEELDELQEDDNYTTTEKKVAKELKKQWDDLVLIGLLRTVYHALGDKVMQGIKNWEMSKEDKKKLEDYISGQAEKKITSLSNSGLWTIIWWWLTITALKWGQSILDQLGSRKDFQLGSSTMLLIQQRIKNMMSWLDRTTTIKMAKNIVKGLENGYSMKRMMSTLISIWGNVSEDRASLIMVTESNALLQHIRFITAKKNWAESKTRRTTEDERTCKMCMNLNNMTVGIDDMFDWVDSPPLHVNCRCRVDYNFDTIRWDIRDWF